MNHFIDVRGKAADQSWLLIMQNIESTQQGCVTTITDSKEKARHIQNMARQCGIEAYLEETGGDYYIHINSTRLQETDKKPLPRHAVVVITGCTLGRGDQGLGKALMKGYLYNLKNVKPYPRCIIFLNDGVRLTVEGSEVLDELRHLLENGVEILSSGTCLEYYGLKSKLAVGVTAGMKEITERMQRCENTLVL
jgi:selenium metabolism protein YedF